MGPITRWLPWAALLLVAAGAASCASSDPDRQLKPRRATVAEFAAPRSQAADPDAPAAQESILAHAQPASDTTSSSEPPSGAFEPAAQGDSGEPPARNPRHSASESPPRLQRPGDHVTINSLIGQINGRPIYANDFFDPIEEAILAKRRELPPADFPAWLVRAIAAHLVEIVDNELFIADAYASLTPEQKMGLFAYLSQQQEDLISKHKGERSALEQALKAEGLTLEDISRMREDRTLIVRLMGQRIRPRVIVSWRDVEREYKRRAAEFNPGAKVKIAGVRFNTKGQAALISELMGRLGADKSLAGVASFLEERGLKLIELEDLNSPTGKPEDAEVREDFKPHLVGLEPGQVCEAFEADDHTYWLGVVSIEHSPGASIYDVQRELTEDVRQRREDQERERYAATLRQRWVSDDLDAMQRRLMVIAEERYFR